MTSNFDKSSYSRKSEEGAVPLDVSNSPAALDNLKRDRFELLSAYLDGEVTVSERRQVEHWLETDQTMRCLYSRLLKLRQGMRTMTVPQSSQSVEQTIKAVCKKVDRRPKVAFAWVGAALALLAIPIFSNEFNLQFSHSIDQEKLDGLTTDAVSEDFSEFIKLDLNSPIVGPAAAGLSGNDHLKELSGEQVMLHVNSPIISIPQVVGYPLNESEKGDSLIKGKEGDR